MSNLGHVLLIGAKGMLGHELAHRLKSRAHTAGLGRVTCWDVDELDISQRDDVLAKIGALKPNVVINSAAYTDVDGCESNEAKALAVNGDGPGYLAEACKACGALLVHVSTDFVFDGAARQPYRPVDTPHPLSAYGRSKLAGERAITESGADHLIVRTSWLFGPHGKNFVAAILARAESGESLRVVDDQTGRPTFAGDLADALLRLAERGARGILHFANSGSCSWHAFAMRIVALAGCEVPVAAINSSELGRPAKRPAYSVLDTTDYERLTGDIPANWEDALLRYLTMRRTAVVAENPR